MAERSVVFWDFDGTLARRSGLWSGALLDALRSVGSRLDVGLDDLRPGLSSGFPWHSPESVGLPGPAEEWWHALQPVFVSAYLGAGIPQPIAARAAGRVRAEFYRPDTWQLIDGAREALQLTSDSGYRNVILSNHGPELPELVAALGLGDVVESTITSAAVGAEKPNRALFEFALNLVGVTAADDVWMVGDNPIADVQGARDAGIRAILADGANRDSRGSTVLDAARRIARGENPVGVRPSA